jgi:hypothetical protein
LSRTVSVIAFLLVLAAVTVRLLTTLTDPGSDQGGYVDFRDAVHAPAAALIDGVDPYDTDDLLAHNPDIGAAFNLYAPHHLLLVLPLAALPIAVAGALWWGLNVLLLLIASRFVIEQTRPAWGQAGMFWLATLALVSNPGRSNFLTGQPTLAIVLGVYLALTSDRPWVAGAGTMLALLKPQFGIPLLLLLAAAGKWRVAARGIGLAATLSLPIVVALVSIEGGIGGLLDAVTDNLAVSAGKAASVFRIDLAGVIIREFAIEIDVGVTVLIALLLTALGSGLVRRWGQLDVVAITVMALVILLSLFHHPYDELILMWPIVGLAVADGLGAWRWWCVGAMTAAAFNPLTVRYFEGDRGVYTLTGLLLVAALGAVWIGVAKQPEVTSV